MGAEDAIYHSVKNHFVEDQVVIMEPEPLDYVPKTVNIFGSNNVVGQNVFIINTNADQNELEQIIKALPPEFLDNFLKAIGTVLQSYHRQNNRGK